MQLKENNSPNIQNHQTHLQQMSQQMQEKDLTNHTNPTSTYQSFDAKFDRMKTLRAGSFWICLPPIRKLSFTQKIIK